MTQESYFSLRLLRKRREHAQIGKIFNVVVGRSLRWVSSHRQHVLKKKKRFILIKKKSSKTYYSLHIPKLVVN